MVNSFVKYFMTQPMSVKLLIITFCFAFAVFSKTFMSSHVIGESDIQTHGHNLYLVYVEYQGNPS